MTDKLDIIYNFGKDVIVKARDMTIQEDLSILEGTAKPPIYKNIFKKMEELSFSKEQKEFMRALIVNAVDGAMNNFIWMMEEHNDKYAFIAKDDDGGGFDIEQESDGLCMGQWEFIDCYSKYNIIDDILETGKIEKETSEGRHS